MTSHLMKRKAVQVRVLDLGATISSVQVRWALAVPGVQADTRRCSVPRFVQVPDVKGQIKEASAQIEREAVRSLLQLPGLPRLR